VGEGVRPAAWEMIHFLKTIQTGEDLEWLVLRPGSSPIVRVIDKSGTSVDIQRKELRKERRRISKGPERIFDTIPSPVASVMKFPSS
jgi:hypothetical protein